MLPSDNETWLIETGDDIIVKKAEHGRDALTGCDRLIYCVWVADYSMRSAGDLLTAAELYLPFREEAQRLSKELHFPKTNHAFSLNFEELEGVYFDVFDDICEELRNCIDR